ncbi:MAG: translation elongation factor Ts [Clostridia bacterium]|nr:translation elongation factor Ts [Clostridia bacterium]
MGVISAQTVKELREMTGCGMMDCKKALSESGGDMDKAVEYLREKGLASAQKKAGRIASEGIVDVIVEGNVGAVLEVNSETDFVGKNADFQGFVKALAKQIIKENPADVDALLASKYIENSAQSVDEALKEKIATIGENMNIRRFVRYEGTLVGYVHGGGRIGVLVKFALGDSSKSEDEAFKAYAKDVAMQIAALYPRYVKREDIPADVLEKEREIFKAQAMNEGKPENIAEKMVQGRIEKYYKEFCLVDQEFVKDPEQNVASYTKGIASQIGTSIEIVEFARLEKGEGLEKKDDNFADEVASMIK